MGAPIQRLWQHVSHLPILSFLRGREPVPELPIAPGKVALEKVEVTFKECEGVCEPTRAAMPATCGAAIDVPDMYTCPASASPASPWYSGNVLRMSTPGAAMSTVVAP